MKSLDKLKWLFSRKGSFIYLLPFFSKSVINFGDLFKFSLSPFAVVFCSNDLNDFIKFLSYISNCDFISFQYAVNEKYIINCDETRIVNYFNNNFLYKKLLLKYIYLITSYILRIINSFIKLIVIILKSVEKN